MLKNLWCLTLCFVIHSISADSTPNVKLPPPSKWPSLISSKSGCPVVPRLEDLKSAFMDRNLKPKKDFRRLKPTTEESRVIDDCNIIVKELEADVSTESNKTEVTRPDLKKEVKNEKKDENARKHVQKPVPRFVPIFRKRKHKRVKATPPPEPENLDSTTEIQNPKDITDSVTQNDKGNLILKTSDTPESEKELLTPFSSIWNNALAQYTIGTKSSQDPREAPLNTEVSDESPKCIYNEIGTKLIPENNAPIHIFPYNTILKNNDPGNLIEINQVPGKAVLTKNEISKANTPKNTEPKVISIKTIPAQENTVLGSTMLSSVPSAAKIPKSIPENTVYAIPVNTGIENHNVMIDLNTMIPKNTVPGHSFSTNDKQILVPLKEILKIAAPANFAHTNKLTPTAADLNANPVKLVTTNIHSVLGNVAKEMVVPLNKILTETPPVTFVNVPSSVDANTNPVNFIPKILLPLVNTIGRSNIPAKVETKKTVLVKTVPTNTASTKTTPKESIIILKKANAAPLTTVSTNPVNIALKNPMPLNGLPVNIEPVKTVHVKSVPTNTISTKTIPNENIIVVKTANGAPPIKVSSNTISTAAKNSLPSNELNNSMFSMPLNGLSGILPPNLKLDIPSPNPDTISVKTGPKEEGSPKKADLVLFKPEDVSLLNVDGDFLKKVTMTVLVPMYVSKLDM